MSDRNEEIIEKVKNTLLRAGSTFPEDKKKIYEQCIACEHNDMTKWSMQTIVENAEIAEQNSSPLCDDTGIPHVILEIGAKRAVTGALLSDIKAGIAAGLRELPGRPMAIMGSEIERINQSGGLSKDSDAVLPAPIQIRQSDDENLLRLHILMQGGGPEIRAKTYRVFHQHDESKVIDEIVAWAGESVSQLGCSPCTIAVGIGRSHFEASSLMLQAMVDGNYQIQSDMEREITNRLNERNIGSLGLGGRTSVLGTFVKIGEQRASGVRIVCMRPCCCFEPRKASVDL